MQGWSIPDGRTAVKKIPGLAGYYRRFVKDFARLALPLTRLTGKRNPFNEDRSKRRRSQSLRKPLVGGGSRKSHFEQNSVLEVDASDHAIGAVLGQIQEDQSVHPVYFGLGSSQRRNATRALRITNVSPSWRRAKSLGWAKVSVVTTRLRSDG